MDWRERHDAAFSEAKQLCRLDSPGHLIIAAIVVIISIIFVWFAAGPNEAWSEILLKVGATAAILMIFPVVYVWKLLRLGEMAQKRVGMLLVGLGVVTIAIGITVLAVGIAQQRAKPIVAGPVLPSTPSENVHWNKHFGMSYGADLVFAIFLDGKGHETRSLILRDAFVESGITGDILKMKVFDSENPSGDPFPISEANPIPPKGHVRLIAATNPNEPGKGIPHKEFLEKWGRVWFNAIYEDGAKDRLLFDESVMHSNFPGVVGPRVTRRANGQK